MNVKKVAIFGSGMMGSGIAQIFACNGIEVCISSRNPEKSNALSVIRENLLLMSEYDLIKPLTIDDILARITISADKAEVMKDTDIVFECIPEVMELKQNLFRDLEDLAREDTIFCSNTSVMSITEIASKCQNKSRVIGTHFWNPPFLIPLVEVVKTEHASEEVVDTVFNLLEKVGRKPIKCNKDVPGFVANRLQHALWREAISIVERGIADAQTVDEAIRYSFGFRLPILAPIENADMVGIDLTYNIHNYILEHLEDSHEPSPLLKEMLDKGDMGFKSGKGFRTWTDEEAKESKHQLLSYLLKMQGSNNK